MPSYKKIMARLDKLKIVFILLVEKVFIITKEEVKMTREERVELIEELACDDCDRGLFDNGHVCEHGYGVLERILEFSFSNGKRDWKKAYLKSANGDVFTIWKTGELLEATTKKGKKLGADDLLEAKYIRRVDTTLKRLAKERDKRNENYLNNHNKNEVKK